MQSTPSSVSCPVADVICRTLELGVHITGEDVTVIEATPREPLVYCPECGAEGRLRDHVIRRLTDVPITGHPTRLHVRLPRYRCVDTQCRRTIVQHQLDAAEPGAKTTKRATTWILKRLIQDQMSISAISRAPGLGWDGFAGFVRHRLSVSSDTTRAGSTPGM